MPTLLPAVPLLAGFVAASLVLAATPGPGVVYIVTRTLSQGRAAGLASVLGVALGNLGNAIGATLGLAALFAVSSAAFTVVQWAGALYLIALGVMALRRAPPAGPPVAPVASPLRRLVRDGSLVALLNPKTTLFFAAFLPQFMDAGASAAGQGAALGVLFVAIAAASDSAYALLAGSFAPALRSSALGRRGRVVTGTTFIALGLATLAGSRPRA